MKKLISSLAFGIAIMALSSCGGSSDSSGMFGGIPQTIEKYNQEKKSIESGYTEANFQENSAKLAELKSETIAKLEKQGEALNGKELTIASVEDGLKIEAPFTWLYKDVFSNVQAVDFALEGGNIVATNDIPLEVVNRDLTYEKDFLGKDKGLMVVKVPVHIQFLDDQNNVLVTRILGNMIADNDGVNAVIKQGSVMDHQGGGAVPVNDQLVNATSAKVVLDVSTILTSYPQQ